MRRKGSRRVIQCLAAKDLPDGVSPKEEDDEKNILTRGGIAHLGRHSFRNGNDTEMDRRLGQLQ